MTRNKMPDDVAEGYLEPYDSWRNRIAVHRFVEDIPLRPSDKAYSVVTDTQDRLSALGDRPMLLCWGMKDFVFDHNFLEEWERRFPDAEVHRFEDAGHYILEDAKEDVLPLVQTFLTREITA
jgi:haloalkane dehalogenase